ncbi:DUF262 domain-containing protein [Mycoplasma feriruminatoris]|uniref:DUF262 domain-containing protein n=1 Tax=Mycoplasma feriruminatoris TaxID=1179777 RepID=A0AAX3TFL4_9MOLU|nr:DUF262 domain-containing HNH endonuclease family protein [Mycoplasma feriruminatoris]WFQ92407.1 hypothetical protein MFERI14822_00177 [Mycoplasma feriruminatoris]
MQNNSITILARTIKQMFSYLEIIEIPSYQREYCWSKENIVSLLNDLLERNKDKRQHFFGTITESTEPTDVNNPNILKHRIIDGQQRLTTSLLLIHFLNRQIIINSNNLEESVFKKEELKLKEFNFEKYSDEPDEDSLKISQDINKIIAFYTGNEPNSDEINFKYKKIEENYNIIRNFLIPKNYKVDEYRSLLDTFLNNFVFSSLLYPVKDPFEEMTIFENLNSKGALLDDLDLIKNFIMLVDQNKKPSENLMQYDRYVRNIVGSKVKESKVDKTIKDFFTVFLKWYLKNKFNDYPSYEIYKNFKKYLELKKEKNISLTDSLKELKKYLLLYLTITNPEKDSHIGNNLWIRVIEQKNVYISLLFALFTKFSKFDNNSEEWPVESIIIDYMKVFSCHIIKLLAYQGTGQSLTEFCLWFEKQIVQNEEMTVQKLSNILKDNSNTEKHNFAKTPDHHQVEESLLHIKDTTKWVSKSVIDVVQTTILNRSNENISHTKKTTLEHIMPQKLSSEWIQYLSDNENITEQEVRNKHEFYLNQIGNLCFIDLGKNSELKNYSFDHKKSKVYRMASAPLINGNVFLQEYKIEPITSYNKWGFEEIQKRSEQIVDAFMKIID